MKNYDLYLFNMDDTLICTYESTINIYIPLLATYLGVDCPPLINIRRHWKGDPFSTAKSLFEMKLDEEEIAVTLQKCYIEHPIKPINDFGHILTTLRKHNKFIGIYSAGYPPLIELSITNSLSCTINCFDYVFSNVEQNISNISPHVVFIMMEKYRQKYGCDVSLDKILLIGDSVKDYSIGKNAMVDFAAVLTGPTTKDEFINAGLYDNWIFPSTTVRLISNALV